MNIWLCHGSCGSGVAHLHYLLRGVMEPVAWYLGAALFYDALRFVRERELEDDLVLLLFSREV